MALKHIEREYEATIKVEVKEKDKPEDTLNEKKMWMESNHLDIGPRSLHSYGCLHEVFNRL